MPQNSTALDFCFSLHTDLGSHCIGAKVNHKLVPLSHKLESGDRVEILTSKSQRITTFIGSVCYNNSQSKAKIAAILKKEQKNFQKRANILHDFLLEEELPGGWVK